VTAKLLGEQKGDKVHVFKYKNKSGYARRQGHRQLMTLIEIADVKLGSAPKRAAAQKPTAKRTTKPAKDEATESEAAEAAE
jgi:large subunit ribosomal protein L21